MANGPGHPVLWQGKVAGLPVLPLNALMRMRFGSAGHVDVQSRLLGMVVLYLL